MKSRTLRWAVSIVVLAVAASIGVLAQAPMPRHFSGLINDYSPSSVSPTGPWEIRGQWALTLKEESGKADFSAVLNMERSDDWVLANNQDPTMPALRMAHTHHITMRDALVTPITGGFEASGLADITKDGSPAPFTPSPLAVDIVGGTTLEFSDVTLTFQPGATAHFGPQAIHGYVRFPRRPDERGVDRH
jgi:hypothetical protein